MPGRCFRLTLVLDPAADHLRIEVSDARGDLRPTGGRGLTLFTALADHWDCVPSPPSGKTVQAVLSAPSAAAG
ncbi:ATP-binding protein [Streptomyces venetus]|uniref:ATP-binding protein n=1 Tax=Streptomyces venetus TaxID=1701086 RepID=UPI003C2B07A9